jgi:hypothetical protein
MLTERILSTLGKEYDNFDDVWGTIPTTQQTVNLLIKKLCATELLAEKLKTAAAMAFVVHENDKEESHFTSVLR